MQSNYENYPFRIIALSNALSLSIYALGLFVFFHLGIVFAVIYLMYCMWVEIHLLRGSCVDCWYYGKFCAFGKGALCAMVFPKGDVKKFIERKVTWRAIVPDIVLLIFPLLGGIIVLFQRFSWTIAGALAALVALSFAGNAFIRGSFACKYCKQRELGCPAAQLFNKAGK